jgi:MarR family transcriptional regulator, organic hydroperoxide resistance regulator
MDPIEELRYLILGAQREGARTLAELLRSAGLTAAQAEVLAVLRDAGRPLTVREIGERLVCESGSPSRLVASLVEAGLLARATRPDDRRAVEHTLTAEGRRAAGRVTDAEHELYKGLAGALNEREVHAMVRGLRKLVDGRTAGEAIARRARPR